MNAMVAEGIWWIIMTMDKQEIIKKVEEREFNIRCINACICPHCGLNLTKEDSGHFIDKVCHKCNLSFPYL